MAKKPLVRTLALALTIWAGAVAAFAGNPATTPIHMDFGNGLAFKGEHVVSGAKAADVGVVTYPGIGVFAGAFVDGVPEGVGTLAVENGPTLVIAFRDGVPVSMYRAGEMAPYHAGSIGMFQADAIAVYQADTIGVFQADTVKPVQARTVDSLVAETIGPYRAGTVDAFKAEVTEARLASVVSKYGAKPVEPTAMATAAAKYGARVAEVERTLANQPVQAPPTAVDYPTPLQQEWMSYMVSLPFLIYGSY